MNWESRGKTDRKIRLVLVGSGWRSLYYVRIAKALPQQFELCAMLCRTKEKAERMAAEQGIYTTTSIEECRSLQPDLVVVAVNKGSISEVSREWLEYGFPVLCETPAALELSQLKELWRLHQEGAKLAVAEQYRKYPVYQAMLKVLETNVLGDMDCLNISLAHEYHGASMMRAFLGEGMTPFQVTGKTYGFPTTETINRYERYTDGRVAKKNRTVAAFEFEDGKVALYDFDSEQYRSPIRKNYVKLQGVRGEMKDESFYYLDSQNEPQCEKLVINSRNIIIPQEKNPNLREVREITGITFGGKSVYEPPFGLCGLAEDETAIAQVMADAAAYARGEKELEYPLANALQDAYMAILLKEAVDTGKTVRSEEQVWQKN